LPTACLQRIVLSSASASRRSLVLCPSVNPNENFATVADIGLTHKDIHQARLIRDADEAEPGDGPCAEVTSTIRSPRLRAAKTARRLADRELVPS